MKAIYEREYLQIGLKIAYFRKLRGLTQEQLAESCSVTAQAVSKWENGLTAPDISLLPRLAELFSVTTDELLGVHRAETVAVDPSAVDVSKLLLRVRVLSSESDEVNVNLPFAAAESFFEGKNFITFDGDREKPLRSLDFARITEFVRSGVTGKLVEVKSADGERVEIWVE